MSRVLVLERVIARRGIDALLDRLATAPFVDGARTAAPGAAPLKHNLQLPGNEAVAVEGARLLASALAESAVFQAATLPVSATPPRFCRYEPGMAYGDHQDSPFMGGARRLRTDIAVTIALSDADSYVGGELVIDSDGAAQCWKGRAGDCVVYPASTLHRVEAVTHGTRSVAILWLQSAVRDANQRALLFELWQAAEALSTVRAPARDVERVRASRAELLRMWSEP